MSALLAIATPRRIKATHRRRRKATLGPSVQRYYDPQVGRFLSIDPIPTDLKTANNFDRYWYANDNPYRFTDPDGRCTGTRLRVADCAAGGGVGIGVSKEKTAFEKIVRNLGWLGSAFKAEGRISFGFNAKIHVGPGKLEVGTGSVTPGTGIGITGRPSFYAYTEIQKPSAELTIGKFSIGREGGSERSNYFDSHGSYHDESTPSAWKHGYDEATVIGSEVSGELNAGVVTGKVSVDFGKIAVSLFYWGNSEEDP